MDAHEARETQEKIDEAAHGEHGHHPPPGRKAIALLISILAAALALAETGANSSQTDAITATVEASNLWSFFQAKTIRKTTLATAADAVGALGAGPAADRLIADWRATADRYEDDPDTGEGRKQLAARARAAEARHDRSIAAYHLFEYGSGALQIGIVLASATIVTGVWALAWMAGGMGLVGAALALLALLAPTALHF